LQGVTVYYYGLMSVQDMPLIDSLRFARGGELREGHYALASLPRVAEVLAETDGDLYYRLEGRTVQGRPQLHLTVRAALSLTCQRCLQALPHVFELESIVWVARNEAELARWDDADLAALDAMTDAIVAGPPGPHLAVQAFVEDEVLLGLPAAPRHAEGRCPASLSAYVETVEV